MSSPLGWGFDPYGTGVYGSTSAGSVSIARAVAVSTHEVDVEVTRLVQDNSPILPGDALNPATWSVVRQDTGAAFNIVSVTQVGTRVYRVLVLEALGPVSVVHTIASAKLLDMAAQLISSPRSADFLGLVDEQVSTLDAALASRRVQVRDYANAPVAASPFEGGTLQLDPGGDYKTETGVPLVKKLILRRLSSAPRDFFHLPDYGIGLNVKGRIPTSDLVKLKGEIERQVLLEPEVETCDVRLLLMPENTLMVQVRGQVKKTGAAFDLSASLAAPAVVL